MRRASFTIAAVLPLLALLCAPVVADPVADFYQGKSISIVIPTSPGGDYDRRARMVARHMGKAIRRSSRRPTRRASASPRSAARSMRR
jgi:tripartite-type tricarboxylate transporter receptor subunit TctC